MKSSNRPKTVKIEITTYNKEKKKLHKMERHCNNQNPKFICSICLNTKPKTEDANGECKRKNQSCPICNRNCETPLHSSYERIKREKSNVVADDAHAKNVQTSSTDIAQGLNLLNEVLTVFQSKKHKDVKKETNIHGKTIIVKDASVSTACDLKPKLTLSKIFQYSIDEDHSCANGNFCIVNCCQPETRSQYSIDLIKHKSSSIPQMKMDELRNSLKEKTKSKDAIEEVNRMFATVKRIERSDSNRPKIRNGPRVLPVVKTSTFAAQAQKSEEFSVNSDKTCKCCETNYCLSSGDSLAKQECCHRQCGSERCEKSVFVCCQYRRRDVAKEPLVCDDCKKSPPGHYM